MLFALKKVIGSLLLPLPLLLLIMAAGLLLLWSGRWQKTGKIILCCAWLLLVLLSLQPVADSLLRPTETRYATWHQQQKVDYVVVLGGGYTWDANWAPSSNMLNNSLPRLTEGIRLWRDNPGAKMIFTGAKAQNNPLSSAEVTSRVAQSLGVPAGAIITLDRPRDTRQEAEEVAKVVGEKPFLLVTSASHLPRAMVFFHQQGLNPLPAPANQLAIASPLNVWEKAIPSSLWLSHSERALYEMLGRSWQKISSQGSAKPGQE
ncbi:envelope biogenesis factor ElyC [Erwinia papayae]|uniref:Envelope biogenesis factor ElyC n=1 Tax=Erwinia papayae TaxID=206499 RepID=A0ABV3MWB6_9GAMM